jgi:hypothetical protein
VPNTNEIIYPSETMQYEVPDPVENLEFAGRMIGKSSTRIGDDPRWTDITIYVTAGGQYIVQKEGVSLVYHRADASCRGGKVVTNPQIIEGSAPCRDCHPPSLAQLDEIRENSGPEGDPARYRREVTLSSGRVTDDPSKVVPLLFYQGRLTTVAAEAFQIAASNDKRLAEVYNQKRIVA